jgi:heptosyltransferase-2
MTEPLLRRLKARGEQLTVGALPWVAPVYRAMAQVDEVIELPFAHGGLQWRARREMAKHLRGQFDRAYVCPNSLKSALLPWWAGIALRVGYHGEGRRWLLNQRLSNPPPGHRPPMVDHYVALSGESVTPNEKPQLQVDAAQVHATLTQWQLQPQGYYVLAPGAEYGPAKRWPAQHFAALARNLSHPVVLLGSAKEASLCSDIAHAVNAGRAAHCANWAGRASLEQAMVVISAARGVISNDSGLMHVAAAFGVPQVAIFGSSSPRHTPPLSSAARVLWLKDDPDYQPALDCAPCFERECPFGHTRCLEDIQPARVLQLL